MHKLAQSKQIYDVASLTGSLEGYSHISKREVLFKHNVLIKHGASSVRAQNVHKFVNFMADSNNLAVMCEEVAQLCTHKTN